MEEEEPPCSYPGGPAGLWGLCCWFRWGGFTWPPPTAAATLGDASFCDCCSILVAPLVLFFGSCMVLRINLRAASPSKVPEIAPETAGLHHLPNTLLSVLWRVLGFRIYNFSFIEMPREQSHHNQYPCDCITSILDMMMMNQERSEQKWAKTPLPL